ncbi:MAG: STAS domain-containing protein [Planctomycetota bacterium]
MPQVEFSIEQEDINQVRVIHINGYLDAHTFQKLDDVIMDVFNDGIYKLAINLENVNYISSAGAGVFIGAHGPARENNGDIILVNPTEGVMRIFELLGITQLFTITRNINEAVAKFAVVNLP